MSKELNIRGYGMINEADGWRSGCLYDSVAFYLDAKGAVPWDTHLDLFCNNDNKTRHQTNMLKIPGRDNPTNTGYRLPDGEEMIIVQMGVHIMALENIRDTILLLREIAVDQHIYFYLDEELAWCQPIFRCVSPVVLRGQLDYPPRLKKNADSLVSEPLNSFPALNVPISITSDNKFKVTIEVLSLHNFTSHAKTTQIYVVLHGFIKSPGRGEEETNIFGLYPNFSFSYICPFDKRLSCPFDNSCSFDRNFPNGSSPPPKRLVVSNEQT